MTKPASKDTLPLTDDQLKAIDPVAIAEGWALFAHNDCHHIERDDESGLLEDDEAAIQFVLKRAAEGSEVHALAIAAHNRTMKELGCPEGAMALTQNDLDAQHAEEFQQWAEADTLDFMVDPVPPATTRHGRLPLTSDQMQVIDEMAQREGWLLAEHSGGKFSGRFMIDKFDEDPRFASDAEAEAFVRKLAEAGSDYHQLALAAHGQHASNVVDDKVVEVTITLKVEYRLNGIGLPVVHNLLRENLEELIGNEGLVDQLPAEVTGWSISFQ
jgi:hypothetical protein